MSIFGGKSLTFDDVQILPRYSEIASRDAVSLRTRITKNHELELPFIASPMPDVCEAEMAVAMWRLGGLGVIHRFNSPDEQASMVRQVADSISRQVCTMKLFDEEHEYTLRYTNPVIAAAIGVNGDFIHRAELLLQRGANLLVIDVAHGHHVNVKNALNELMKFRNQYTFDIMAGSIATIEAATELMMWGADGLRCGIGGGSACETRIRTGIGVPQLSSVDSVSWGLSQIGHTVPITSDGGIRYPGDAAKAIAAGATAVMIGNLFAGTNEAPGEELTLGTWPDQSKKRIYKGAASATQKMNYNGTVTYIEGATSIIDARGPVKRIVDDLADGLRSSLSYVGTDNIVEFQDKAEFVEITQAGMAEARPHMLYKS